MTGTRMFQYSTTCNKRQYNMFTNNAPNALMALEILVECLIDNGDDDALINMCAIYRYPN